MMHDPIRLAGPRSRLRPWSVCEGVMIRLDLSYFYRLAATFAEARAIVPDTELFNSYGTLLRLESTINQLLSDPTMGSSLRGCQPAAKPLLNLVGSINDRELGSKLGA